MIFLREYAAYIKDSMVAELCELNRNMMLSVDIIPVPTDEAVREVENRLLGVETNITNWQRKQNQNNNFSAVIPYDLSLIHICLCGKPRTGKEKDKNYPVRYRPYQLYR